MARLEYPLVAACLLAFLVFAWLGRVPAMRSAGDDEFKYIALSRSLETGSYREIFRPGAPLHAQYPPGYPAWLIAVRHVLGEQLDAIRVTNLVMTTLAIGLWFLVARRLLPRGLALGFLLLLVLNRSLLAVGSSLASEGLFLLLCVGSLMVMQRSEHAERRTLPAILGGLLGFLTRSVGLALIVAVGSWLWIQRRRRALLAWALSAVLIVGGWFGYTLMAPLNGTVRSYAKAFAETTSRTSGPSPVRVVASRVWHHGMDYATTDMPYQLSLPTLPGTRIDNWAWLLIDGLLLSVGLLVLWRRWRAAAVYVVGSVALLLLWPFQDGRLLIPLVPLGLLALLAGAARLSERLPQPARHLVPGGLLVLLTLGALGGAREWAGLYRSCDRRDPYHSAGCYDPGRLAFVAGAQYLRDHAAPGDQVLSREPATLNYLSGLLTEPPHLLANPPGGDPVAALQAQHIRFVFVTSPWMASSLEASCDRLQVEQSYLPLAVLLSAAPPGTRGVDACLALREIAVPAR
ncbi:MAG TPA: hypothetical protein VL241_01340 [Gemmatimonadales bacterium]|nr:hypothetical protein [Gemmatimonadales bacterium]